MINLIAIVIGVLFLIFAMTAGLWIAAPLSYLVSLVVGGVSGMLIALGAAGQFD